MQHLNYSWPLITLVFQTLWLLTWNILYMQNISPLTLGAILSSEPFDTRTLKVGYQIWASATVFTRIRGAVVDIYKGRSYSGVKTRHVQTLYAFPTPLYHQGFPCIFKTKVITLMPTSFPWEVGIQEGST